MAANEYSSVRNSEKANDNTDDVPRSAKKGWSRFSITSEPIFFLIQFTSAFTSGITIDLLEDNICQNRFNLTLDECNSDLHVDKKSAIEAMTADVNMVNNVIQGAFPVLLSLIIGPWSDSNGRKPFIKLSLLGYTLFYFLWGILSLIPEVPVMCYIIPAIPLSLSGGWTASIVCIWSYLSDVYEEHERPMRLAVMIGSGVVGSLIGNGIAAQVFYACGQYGYQVMFFSSALTTVVALLYTFFVLKESVTRKGKKTKFINPNQLKSIFVALLCKPRHSVIVSLLTMIILTSELTSGTGDNNFMYLVGKSEFDWTLGDYNLFSAILNTISVLSPLICIWLFSKKLRWHNYSILASFSTILLTFNVLKSLSVNESMFWTMACLHRVSAIIGPVIDSEMSKIVHEKDVGKAYAFSALIDALSPVLSMPIFTELYKVLLPDKVLYIFFIKSGLSLFTVVSSMTLLLLWKYKRSRFWRLHPIDDVKPVRIE